MPRTVPKIILLILGLLFSCKTRLPRHELQIEEYATPPGTIKLGDNLYFDEAEITNFSYHEYMYWMARVYYGGKEYKSILPDTITIPSGYVIVKPNRWK